MYEGRWLDSDNPTELLDYLQHRVSERKLRLFACGCVRQFWDLLTDWRSLAAVEMAEQEADGKDIQRVWGPAMMAARDAEEAAAWPLVRPARAAAETLAESAWEAASLVAHEALDIFARGEAKKDAEARNWSYRPSPPPTARVLASRHLCELIREVFGNPFRPLHIDREWLDWRAGTVRRLARLIYDERRFGELPILADALEDAGCDSAPVLEHLHSDGPHVRGCHALDALLGFDRKRVVQG